MRLKLLHSNKFEANKWLVTARWFYAPTIFVIGLLLKLDPLGYNFFPVPTMMFLFFLFVLCNLFFWRTVRKAEIHNDGRLINIVAVTQVVVEMVFFLAILHLSGGDQSVAPIFFFIPVVTSIVLFDVVGSLIIAFISALFLNGLLLLDYFGYLRYLYGYTGSGTVDYYDFIVRFMSTTTYTAVYLIVGALAGYLTSVIKRRDEDLEDERRKAQFQAERLRMLNAEYSEYARELVRRDLELKKENEKITEIDREKTQFVSTAAHQLRTPLSAIKWTLDLLLKDDVGELKGDQRALVMKAYESNERIIRLIRDMLGADQLEGGNAFHAFFDIDIRDLLDNVLGEFDSILKRKKIHVSIESDGQLTSVAVDPQKMRAVFQNLLENAAKYTKTTIAISLKKDGDMAQITMRDDGIGVPDADRDNIFKRFFRAGNAMKVDPDGSGLGLFIVRAIVEKHGGTITLDSIVNKGSTFIIRLPISHKKI